MIKRLRHDEIDKEQWDACIAAANNHRIYAFSWYLDIVSPQWEALVLNDYEAVMPLTVKKKWGFTHIAHPYFAQQLGLFSKESFSRSLFRGFLRAIPKSCVFVSMKLNTQNQLTKLPFRWKKKQMKNMVLSLQSSYENLKKLYLSNTKRNIIKAKQNKLQVRTEISIADFVQFKMQNSSHLKPAVKQTMEKILQALEERQMGECFGVFDGATLLAAAFMVTSFDRYIYLVSASSEEGYQQRAMFLLVDRFIEIHSHEQMVLDFEGSTIPGISRFFHGFGALPQFYQYITNHPFALITRR